MDRLSFGTLLKLMQYDSTLYLFITMMTNKTKQVTAILAEIRP
jgi:hypothetical protein